MLFITGTPSHFLVCNVKPEPSDLNLYPTPAMTGAVLVHDKSPRHPPHTTAPSPPAHQAKVETTTAPVSTRAATCPKQTANKLKHNLTFVPLADKSPSRKTKQKKNRVGIEGPAHPPHPENSIRQASGPRCSEGTRARTGQLLQENWTRYFGNVMCRHY